MEDNKPYFHQINFGDYLAQRVRIPPLFMKHLSEDMSDKVEMEATIKSVSGSWPVKLRKRDEYTFIEDGWRQVMEENVLGDNEFLLFRYDGDMRFNLQIFEKNGCERIRAIVKPKEKKSFAFSSQNPHFRVYMKEYHVERTYILRLPKDFTTRLHPSSETMTMLLENSKGEAWDVNVTMNSGSYCFCREWRTFVHANNLKLGDECIFELLSQNKMRVHCNKHEKST